jgi:hypothetical protein
MELLRRQGWAKGPCSAGEHRRRRSSRGGDTAQYVGGGDPIRGFLSRRSKRDVQVFRASSPGFGQANAGSFCPRVDEPVLPCRKRLYALLRALQ